MKENDIEANLLKGAVFFNSSVTMDPSVQSTGFMTSSLNYRTLGLNNSARTAEEFLINTRLIRGDAETTNSIQNYFEEHSTMMLSMEGEEFSVNTIPLPKGVVFKSDFSQVVNSRRSIRSFTGDPIHLSYLATIIRLASGISGIAKVELVMREDPVELKFRTIASGGGLYPVDLYIVANNIEGLASAIYRYRPLQDDLVMVCPENSNKDLLNCISMPEEMLTVSKSNAIFLMIARPWKSMRKYGNRGMRFVFMETGAMAQNINLSAKALGLGTCDCASIYDDEVHKLLGIDGTFTALTHAVVLGCTV